MRPVLDPLLRHLALLALVKLVVLGALWSAFVQDQGVELDTERMSAHLQASPPPTTAHGEAP